MNRNLDLIVSRVESYYDILAPGRLEAPRLYVTTAPYSGEEEYLCDMPGNSVVIPDPTPGKRPYFVVKGGGPDVTAGDRLVDLPAVENFRDLGGYRTADGRTVKWGRFFRGGALGCHTPEDRARCDAIGLRQIFDYRDQGEYSRAPDYVPAGCEHHLIPAIQGPILQEDKPTENKADVSATVHVVSQVRTREDADRFYEQFRTIYRFLPFGNPAYRMMLDALDREETVPLYQHCSAGKDRTGVGCALLLIALGVDEDTAKGDYLLSRAYRESANRRFVERHRDVLQNEHAVSLMQRMSTVEESLIQTALDAIRERYPDYETFFREEYGVTGERLAHWRALHLV